jgi:hypothetical protein
MLLTPEIQSLLKQHPQLTQNLGPQAVIDMHSEGRQRGFLLTRNNRVVGLHSGYPAPSVDVNLFHDLSALPRELLQQIPHLREFQEFLQVKFGDDIGTIRNYVALWSIGKRLDRFHQLLSQFNLHHNAEI